MTTPLVPYTHPFGDAVQVDQHSVRVSREDVLATPKMDQLAHDAVFGDDDTKAHARWLIWELGQKVGTRPASIFSLYHARGTGASDLHGFTVPAINVRGLAYDTARSVFRTAKKLDVGAFILEIARSEIGYTDQRPAEYTAVVLAAALREGFRGPVFIQGDHFQVNVKKYATDPTTEVNAVKQLAREAVAAGFFQIDVDTSTLVDISRPTIPEQQRLNYEVSADIAAVVRSIEPHGVTISLGGEIGEVGGHNSTPPELVAYMDGFDALHGTATPGLAKISVQTGTSHGGVVLPDGSIADVKLDLDVLAVLSKLARDQYRMAGAVQHGASTLPDSAFHHFRKTEACEIHLATNFMNMLYDHLPDTLRTQVYEWLKKNAADERKASDTDEQFFYKTRKKALGPFKRAFWEMPVSVREQLGAIYDAKFAFLFDQLGVVGSTKLVAKYVTAPTLHRSSPDGSDGGIIAAPDDTDLSD
jgi:fructose-bisphosphate aldolase, class II